MSKEQEIRYIEQKLELMEYKDHWTPADWSERNQLTARLEKLRG